MAIEFLVLSCVLPVPASRKVRPDCVLDVTMPAGGECCATSVMGRGLS